MVKNQITHLYKIFNHGTYLGLLPNVSSDFSLNETINTIGAQIQINVGQSADIANQSISPILDEAGAILLDELGSAILPERVSDIVGSSNSNILIQNDNDIQVWEYSKDNPNGVCVFQGYISKWKANFGNSNDIQITCLSNGQDLGQFIIEASDTKYITQETGALTTPVWLNISGKLNTSFAILQTFQIPDATKKISSFGFQYTNSIADTIQVTLYQQLGSAPVIETDTLLGTVSLSLPTAAVATSAAGKIGVPVTLVSGTTYYWFLSPNDGGAGTFNIYYSSANPYASGQVYTAQTNSSGGAFVYTMTSQPTWDLFFDVYSYGGNTTTGYTNQDVSSVIVQGIMQNYVNQGGMMAMPVGGYAASGQLSTYTFKVQTLLQGIQTCQNNLAPPNYWYYAEPSNSTLYFQASNTSADFTLIKGRHINDLDIEATKETIKNVVYFTGGDDGTATNTNIFVKRTNTNSINLNRRGLAVMSDNRVNSTTGGTGIADVIASNEITNNSVETYITSVTIDNSAIDTTLLKIGKMVAFSGFGNFAETLLLQIVGRSRNPYQTTLTLGTLPARVTQQVKDIQGALAYLETVNNPVAPGS